MRRALLGTVAAAVAGTFLVAAPAATAAPDGDRLVRGAAAQAGLLERYLDRLEPDAREGLQVQSFGHPAYAGAAVLVARHGVVARSFATGYALRYATSTQELPRDRWIPARPTTMFDLASLTKTFTAVVATRLMADGRLGLEAPVVRYLPEFGQAGKGGITIRMLLTHTSGLPADPSPPLWSPAYSTNAQRWAAIMATVPVAAPGSQYLYSDVNYLVLQRVIERVTGHGLARVIRDVITAPLGMTDTMFTPPASLRHRIAATEYQEPPLEPSRGMVWGSVDDENAWALGGVAGHAGLFSTTHDLAIYAQMILNRGEYAGVRIVPRRWANGFFRDYNTAYPGNGHSLIMQINQYPDYFGALDTLHTIGHTGFTGTSIVINPHDDAFAIMLTNRVHPTRDWTATVGDNPQRRAIADDLARAVPVRPLDGAYSWFSGMAASALDDAAPAQPATLTVPVPVLAASPRVTELRFNLWYRLIPPQAGPPAESCALQVSVDSGVTWRPLGFTLRGPGGTRTYPTGEFTGLDRVGWSRASARLPVPAVGVGRVLVRWQYTNQAVWQGRGVYVNGVRAMQGGTTIFDDARPPDAARVVADGGFRGSAN